LPDSLDTQLDSIFAARDRENMRPTIDALHPLRPKHPKIHLDPLYESRRCHPTQREKEGGARHTSGPWRERRGDIRRPLLPQYRASPQPRRNRGRNRCVFARARDEFPESRGPQEPSNPSLHAAGRLNLRHLLKTFRLLADRGLRLRRLNYKPACEGGSGSTSLSLDAEPQQQHR